MYEHFKLAIEAIKSNYTTKNCVIIRDNFQEVCANLYIDTYINIFFWKSKTDDVNGFRIWDKKQTYPVNIEVKFTSCFYILEIKIKEYKININDLPVKNLLDITEEDLFYIKLMVS